MTSLFDLEKEILRKAKVTFWSFLFFGLIHGQTSTCNSLRYENYVFSEVETIKEVLFHQDTSISGRKVQLEMDIFMPKNDPILERPLVVLAHGGGFFGGDKSSLHYMSIEMAKRGYVAASINYRLIDDIIIDKDDYIKAFSFAIEDMVHAIDFFKRNAGVNNDFKVDTNLVFVGGISAGAIMAVNLNFLDAHSYPTLNEKVTYGDLGEMISRPNYKQPKACLNFSGAIQEPSIIDSGDPPIFSYHNLYDNIVPCHIGISANSPFKGEVYGSCFIEDYLDSISHENHILHIDDSSEGHITYLNRKTKSKEVFQRASGFLKNVICKYYESESHEARSFELNLVYNNKSIIKYLPLQCAASDNPYVEIYTKNGQLVYKSISRNTYQLTINNAFLTNGLYYIKLKSSIDQCIEKIYLNSD